MGLLFERIVKTSFGLAGEEFTVVTGLFTQFEIEKTSEKTPNRVGLRIFNLNETSRATLQQKNVIVKFDAGYGEKADELFVGNITRAGSEKSGPDIITMIEAGDATKQFSEAQVNKTLGPGANTKQVIEEVAKQLNVGIGAIKGVTEEIFQNGITLTGNATDRLDDVVDKLGLEWSIQDDRLQILPPDEPSEILGILLTSNTGLIGSPIKREDGIEFRALLRAQLKPGAAVQLRSREIDGFFKIRKAVYTGDNRRGPYQVVCEGKEIPSGASLETQTLNIGAVA